MWIRGVGTMDEKVDKYRSTMIMITTGEFIIS